MRRGRLVGLLLAVACGAEDPGGTAPARVMDVATTTSVRDSGLLEALLPVFLERTGIEVRLIVVGSGAALRMGAKGEVDALITHAPGGELELVQRRVLVDYKPVMRNHFVLAGPPGDPAGVADAGSAVEAVRRLAAADAPFVSRGDDSGTHRREKAVLEKAGLDPERPWAAVLRTHAGMGQTLQVAGEKRAYVLADVGTFRAFRERIDLVAHSDPDDPELANVYSASRPSPGKAGPGEFDPGVGQEFVAYLIDRETQRRIRDFGSDETGRPLFIPLQLDEVGG